MCADERTTEEGSSALAIAEVTSCHIENTEIGNFERPLRNEKAGVDSTRFKVRRSVLPDLAISILFLSKVNSV